MANQKGIGLAALSAGIVFIYGGFKGYSPLKAIQNVIQGKPANTGQSSSAFTSGGTNSSSTTGIVSGGLSNYNHSQLMQLWIENGGNPSGANNAACHAIQESSGNASATSANPDGGTNVGLWQLDTNGKGAGYTVQELQSPSLNAKLAIKGSSNGADWSAWATPGC